MEKPPSSPGALTPSHKNTRPNTKRTGELSKAGAPFLRVLGEGVGDRTHPNTKRTGELSEAAFLLKASSQGFGVAKPWGDSERYDFILDSGCRRWRVQLKCTAALRARGYDVQPIYAIYGRGKVVYSAEDIDVLVAHIIPVDAWYVLPIEVFAPSRSLRFYPDIECRRARWEQYREAWSLLRTHPQCKGLHDWRQCYRRGIEEETKPPPEA